LTATLTATGLAAPVEVPRPCAFVVSSAPLRVAASPAIETRRGRGGSRVIGGLVSARRRGVDAAARRGCRELAVAGEPRSVPPTHSSAARRRYVRGADLAGSLSLG